MTDAKGKPAVFLDRDGTLNIERAYLSDPEQLELYPDVTESLIRLRDVGFLLFIVTNQSGIGRGYYTEEDMRRVNRRLEETLKPSGIHFEMIYFAPEHPDEPSPGRKPSPQFLLDAARDFAVDLSASFMVGDKMSDIRCGWNAGVRKSILVRTGYGSEVFERHEAELADSVVTESLSEAVNAILNLSGRD